jgi:hypothetical protein
MPRLLLNFGTPAEAPMPLLPGLIRIGRAEGNDYRIDHPSISSHHCELVVADENVLVRDLASTNGTFIDGLPVREAPLQSGQTLRLGDVELLFDADTPAELAALPPAVPLLSSPESIPVPPPLVAVPAMPAGPMNCANHPRRQARLYCPQCRKVYCELCVRTGRSGGVQAKFCQACGSEVSWISAVLLQPPRDERTFFDLLPGAFIFPFQGDGWILMVTGTAFCLFVHLVVSAPRFVLLAPLESFSVLIVMVFACGYLFAYQLKIIAESAIGRESMPDWPDFTGVHDVISPFLQFLFLAFVCFAPTPAIAIAFHDQEWDSAIAITTFVIGSLYFPMSLLALAMFDTVTALNPVIIVPSIIKVFREYLVACAVMLGMVGTQAIVSAAIRYFSPRGPSEWFVLIAMSVVSGFVAMYCLTVEMRVLGLLYRGKKNDLGWFTR